jgi:hypothetical protein
VGKQRRDARQLTRILHQRKRQNPFNPL